MTTTRNSTIWLKRLFIVFAMLLFADQVVLRTVLADGVFLGIDIAPFRQPLFSNQQRQILADYEELLANDREELNRQSQFDPTLGWCTPRDREFHDATYDWSGSRLGPKPLPRERGEGERLIGLVGCSFTLGSEVSDKETWAYGLDERWPNTRIGNFGVGGYGVDQAYLRYTRDVAPLEPDEVWLGLFPNAIMRTSSQFPPLYGRWRARTIFFKPRFSLEGSDELQFHPSPAHRPEDVVRLVRGWSDFNAAIGDDPWIRRAQPAYALQGSHWSHHTAFTRLFLTLHERRGRDAPAAFRDDSSEIYRVHRALVLQLQREVEATGAKFRVLVLPSQIELRDYLDNGHGYWQGFVTELRGEGIEVLDLCEALSKEGVVDRPECWMPFGHHSGLTHRIIVDAIAEAWPE